MLRPAATIHVFGLKNSSYGPMEYLGAGSQGGLWEEIEDGVQRLEPASAGGSGLWDRILKICEVVC